jgi:hypothetical protein
MRCRQKSGKLLCAGLACVLAGTMEPPVSAAAQQAKDVEKKLKNRSLRWSPPLIDAPLRGRIASPACDLSHVLEQAGARANELVAGLQNFTAQEKIEYQAFDRLGYAKEGGTGTFDYVVDFQQALGGLVVQESRNPTRGSRLTAAMAQDVGLPEMALMFLPEMQGDYAMTCEGTIERNDDHRAIVYHTFTNFMLFSVQTDQRSEKPKEP